MQGDKFRKTNYATMDWKLLEQHIFYLICLGSSGHRARLTCRPIIPRLPTLNDLACHHAVPLKFLIPPQPLPSHPTPSKQTCFCTANGTSTKVHAGHMALTLKYTNYTEPDKSVVLIERINSNWLIHFRILSPP